MERGEKRVIEIPVLDDPAGASIDEPGEYMRTLERLSRAVEIEYQATLVARCRWIIRVWLATDPPLPAWFVKEAS